MSTEPSQRAKDLEAAIRSGVQRGYDGIWALAEIQAALDAERTELEGIAKGLEDVTIRKDKRIAKLEALLAKLPHNQTMKHGEYQCIPSCPACAFNKLQSP